MSGVGVPSLSRPTAVTRSPVGYAPTVHPYLISETLESVPGLRPVAAGDVGSPGANL